MKNTIVYIILGATALAAGATAGCADPWSQRRIACRQERVAAKLQDFREREERGARRNRAAARTLQEWLDDETERWQRRAPTIGDYLW